MQAHKQAVILKKNKVMKPKQHQGSRENLAKILLMRYKLVGSKSMDDVPMPASLWLDWN